MAADIAPALREGYFKARRFAPFTRRCGSAYHPSQSNNQTILGGWKCFA
jgi:hypothetical protein